MKNSRKAKAFPIVAIGASAGGLKAFEDLLNALPRNPGMAFILVPHLAPQFKSHLAEILARCTRLPVGEVQNGDRVEPNRIYVVPSNRAMRLKGGTLQLSVPDRKTGRHYPIDGFFRSLAGDQREMAIGVLLSGAGSDGTAGLQAIKERGGTTFAQDADTAAHLSMPHSAVVSGCVDFVLSPREIGRRLGIGRLDGGRPQGKPKAEDALNRILECLRAAKGVEFGLYKRNTLRRRIQRRMALRRVREPEKYLRLLKSDPEEVDQLFNAILICVTSFFREPESFRALKSTIYPRIVKNTAAGAPARIWVAGCSTGEEAYSHAMNLLEFLGKRAGQLPFQIFATDVNPAVIERARAGYYTKRQTAGLSGERLKRFFVETEDGYRIAPFLRERCVFAVHNLVQDPPFTSLDLISCRNLMIYLGPALQEKVLQIFQYALKPRGLLMLGRSESVGDFSGRFTPLDEKRKVFSVRAAASKARLDFTPPSRFLETDSAFTGSDRAAESAGAPVPAVPDLQGRLDAVLPARYTPNGVIVNAELEILRFLGNTSPYLRQIPGKPSLNLRRMAEGEFLLELRAAIQASKESAGAVGKEIAAPDGGAARRIRFEVLPIKSPDHQKEYFLLIFEEAPNAEAARPGKDSRRIVELKEDLAVSGAHLKSIIDEQESTNARLKASNESLLSSNEELQSINEEFETTKEELQSTNEELQSANEELTTSTEEVVRGSEILSRANNDLSNLLANINIPVVLLDTKLTVHRFTPAAEKALGLSSDKVGRSIVDMELPLRLPDLKQQLLSVIKNGRVQSQEVQDAEGRWYYLIIRPYRTDKSKTQKSRTEGAVMALVDIQERKLAEKALLRLATVVLDSNDAIIVADLKDRIIAWNKGAQKMYGYTEKEALGMSIRLLMPGDKRIRARDLVRVSAAPIEIQRRTRDGRILDVLITVTVLRDAKGQPVEVATTERDITAQKKSERDRKSAEKSVSRLATVVLDSNDAVTVCDLEDKITAWNKGAQKMYGYAEKEALGMSIRRLMPKNKLIRAR
ncbi:MAG: CheR family methyltransferase, partial [Elusimicrobiota bacterium]|nr:CheR family methyltransferase [Elusimicrobiota bacterium]